MGSVVSCPLSTQTICYFKVITGPCAYLCARKKEREMALFLLIMTVYTHHWGLHMHCFNFLRVRRGLIWLFIHFPVKIMYNTPFVQCLLEIGVLKNSPQKQFFFFSFLGITTEVPILHNLMLNSWGSCPQHCWKSTSNILLISSAELGRSSPVL